jgi:hypothetical protein
MSKSNEEKLKEILRKHSLIKWWCYLHRILKRDSSDLQL